MITLIQAFRLLEIKDEGIYMTTPDASRTGCYWFWSENVRKFFNMKKVKVVRIRRHFVYSYDDRDYELVVTGISAEELDRISRKIA